MNAMKMWQTSLLVTFGIAGLIGTTTPVAVHADGAQSSQSATTATVQSNINYTLAGDAIVAVG